MPIVYCPRCQTPHLVAKNTTDFICNCNSGDESLDNDNVKVIGDWEDYTGSGKVNQPFQSSANKLQGDRAKEEFCEHDYDRNVFGQVTSHNRLRQHQEHFEIKPCNK